MQKEKNIIRKYAISFLEIAATQKNTDKIIEELNSLTEAFTQNKQTFKLLCSSTIKIADRKKLLQDIIQENKINSIIENFILLLVENKRLKYLEEITTKINDLNTENYGKIIEVVTTKKLNEQELETVKEILQKEFNQNIIIKNIINENILGGIIVRYGSMLIDASYDGLLKKIKNISLAELDNITM